MRRQLNIKFMVGLLAATLLLGVGLYLLYAYQLRRHAAALLARADRAEEQSEPARGIKYLERYLALKPDDAAVLGRYGLALAEHANSPGNRDRALAVLAGVLRRSPGRADLRRWRVTLAMAQGQHVRAREDLDVLLEAAPRDGELEQLRGQCEQAAGDAEKAAAWFTKAIEHAPGQIDSYVRLAGLLRGPLPDPEGANQVMENLVAANPTAAAAYLARARYRQEFQSLDEAAKDLDRARELAPDQLEVLLASGKLSVALGKLDEARGYMRRGLDLYPDHAALYLSLAAVEQQAGRHKEAIACLRQGVQTVPASARPGLLLGLLDLLVQAREVAPAAEVLTQLRSEAPSPLLSYYEARLLILKGLWAQAAELLQRVRPLLVRSPELGVGVYLLLGDCYEKLGDPQQQLTAYTNAVDLDGRSSSARLQLGSALLARGNGTAAVNEFRQLLKLKGAPVAGWALLARGLMLRNLQLPPLERKWEEVAQALQEAAKVNPADADVPILVAEVYVAQGKPDRARQTLKEACAQHPDQVALWVAQIEFAERQGQPEAAAALLEEARQKLGERAELRLLRLRGVSQRGGAAAKAALARQEEELAKETPADQERLLGPLADAYLQVGEVAAAERLWNRLAERQPNNLGLRLLLFDLAVQTNKDQEAQRVLQEIKRIEGDNGTWWRYAEATCLILQASKADPANRAARLDQAGLYLAEVAKRRRDWSRVSVAEAQIQELLGHADAALDKYQQALEQGDRQPLVIQRLVRLLYEGQRFQEADQVIRKLQEESALPEGLHQLAAVIALKNLDAERALALAKQAVAEGPKDHRNHLWLGLSLWGMGKGTEAEASLRRALELTDQVPETWVGLVQYLAASGQVDKAEAVTKEAAAKLPAAQAPLALAQCCESLGRRDEAEKHYQAALAASPAGGVILRTAASFYLRAGPAANAVPLLRKLLDSTTQASAADAAWARRNLAIEIAERGNYQQFREAMALIAGNRQANQPETVEDRHARACVLSTRPCHQAEAISELNELGIRRPLSVANQYLLVRLYESRGQWEAADRRMESVLALAGNNQRYLAHYARSKLLRKDAAGAKPWLDKLVQLNPKGGETVELRARMLQAQGRGAEAAALVLQFLDPASDKPAEADATTMVVGLLEELGQAAAAEKLFRGPSRWSEKPENRLLYIRFLGRQKRLAEALDLCEQAWESCAPEAVASASLALLRAGPAGPEQVKRVERRLEVACQREPGAKLLAALADFRDFQGRYDEAEALYRRVLKMEPGNVLALNNLAWLLVLRNAKAEEPLALINHALDLFGPEARLLDTRAVIYLAAERTDLALEDLGRALEQQPSPSYLFHSALAHLRAKNKTAAGEDMRKAEAAGFSAASLHPLDRPTYQQLLTELDQP